MKKSERNTNITLAVKPKVDVDSITQKNVKEKINFTDDRGDPVNPSDPVKWVSKVDNSKKVQWAGVNDPGRNIAFKIIEVNREQTSPVKILKEDIYKDQNKDGIVIGDVRNTEVTGEEQYKITFTINAKELHIDPKLKMN
jgi:hypothetical protein